MLFLSAKKLKLKPATTEQKYKLFRQTQQQNFPGFHQFFFIQKPFCFALRFPFARKLSPEMQSISFFFNFNKPV